MMILHNIILADFGARKDSSCTWPILVKSAMSLNKL